MIESAQYREGKVDADVIHLPSPTAWPVFLALA